MIEREKHAVSPIFNVVYAASNAKILILALLLLFVSTGVLQAWEGLSISDSRERTMAKLDEISKKYASDAMELSKKAKALADATRKSKSTTDWIDGTLEFFSYAIDLYPPAKGNDAVRKDLLWLLDSVLNVDNTGSNALPLTKEEKLAYGNAVNSYRYGAWDKLIDEVASTKVPSGSMAVWKVNNMGIIAKTKSHTFGFDIYMPGVYPSDIERPRDLDEKYAKTLDALFISHAHGDHIPSFMTQMLKHRKKVFTVWDSTEKNGMAKLYGTDGKFIDVDSMQVMSIAGSQGKLLNSITIVRSDGVTIAHEGDNTSVPAYDKLGDAGEIDIVIGQVHFYYEKFTRKAHELAPNGKREFFFFSGHEEELGHKVNIRMPFYHFSNPKMADADCFVLTYGDGVFYPSGESVNSSGKPGFGGTKKKTYTFTKPSLKKGGRKKK